MKYYIIGNGGFAKEVFCHLEDFNGFIDYKPMKLAIEYMGLELPVIDEDEFLAKKENNSDVYSGVGEPELKVKVVKKFKLYSFPNLVHKNVVKDVDVRMDKGNVIATGCALTVDTIIGSFNFYNLNSTIGHVTCIEDYNFFNLWSNISGSVSIGDSDLFRTNSTVLNCLNGGSNSIIGASSFVNKDINSEIVVAGIPVKEIKKNV